MNKINLNQVTSITDGELSDVMNHHPWNEEKIKKGIEELRHRAKTNPLLLHKSLPQQKLFEKDPAKIKIIFGGNRAGKSECVCKYIINKALKNENQRIWVSGCTFSDSVNIQQRKIAKFLPWHHVQYGKYSEINGFTNRKLQFVNSSLITFKSYDQERDAFQGDDIDFAVCDEEPPIDIWKEIKMRLIDRDGELLLSMTSLKGVTDLVDEVFDSYTAIQTRYAELVDEELPVIAEKNGVRIYFLWTTDNPYVNQERLRQEARLMTKEEIKSRIYGIPVNLQGKIYMKFNTSIHVVERTGLDIRDAQIWHVLDPHDRKPWAIAWFAVWKTGHACCVDEYPNTPFTEMMFDDKTYDDYEQLIKSKEKRILSEVSNKHIKRIIDPNFGNKTVQLAERQGGQSKTTPVKELAKRGLHYTDGIDALEAGHLEVRQWIHWDVKDGELIVQPKLYVADNCINVITSMSRYSRKDVEAGDGDIKDNVKPQEKYKDHCLSGDTTIQTSTGIKNISDIIIGDFVLTDVGYMPVVDSKLTEINASTIKVTFSNGIHLIGTPDHKVYLSNGSKKRLDLLRYGDIIMSCQEKNHIIGKSEEADISNSDQGLSIEKYGYCITAQYPKAFKYITKTEINSTMKLTTLKQSLQKNIGDCILCLRKNLMNLEKASKKELQDKTKWLHGINQNVEERGLKNTLKKLEEIFRLRNINVVFVVKSTNLKLQITLLSFVQIIVSLPIEENLRKILKKDIALYVTRFLKPTNILKLKHAPKSAVHVVRSEQSFPRNVYSITVKDAHRYYANGILVSNCDLIRYFCTANPRYIEQKKFKTKEGRAY